MSHGNIPTAYGTCDVCGRREADLHRARYKDILVCVDEFACFRAWQELRARL